MITEVGIRMEKLKKGKGGGENEVTGEMVKGGGDTWYRYGVSCWNITSLTLGRFGTHAL